MRELRADAEDNSEPRGRVSLRLVTPDGYSSELVTTRPLSPQELLQVVKRFVYPYLPESTEGEDDA